MDFKTNILSSISTERIYIFIHIERMQKLENFSILVRQLAQHAPSTTKQSASVHFSS